MTSILDRLRQETRPVHQQTEQLFYTGPLQAGTLMACEYRHLLRTHLVFHQALEAAIDRQPAFFRAYDLPVRQKTPWLLADLSQLTEPLPPAMPELFGNWSPVMLLGAAYVGEGSMLGGSVVWKLLQQNPAVLPLLDQARFYQGYGPATGRYWQAFGSFLTLQAGTDADAVVEAAQQTFGIYQTIFRQTNT